MYFNKEMEFSLTSLPDEVLSIVFTFLSVEDKLKACVVCKHWLQLINCHMLLSDINVCINNSNQGISIFMSTTRNFINFSFHHILINNYVYNFLKTLSHVKSISFIECVATKSESVDIDITAFKHLQELNIISFQIPFECWFLFPSLPNLSQLKLSGRDLIYDCEISVLQKSIKNLKILTIDSHIVSNHRIYSRFYPQRITYEEKPSSDILSFIAVKNFISDNVYTLSELNLSCISSSALKELSNIKGLNLKKISLSVEGFCYDSMINLFLTQRNLKILRLKSMNLNEKITESIYMYLTNVENINVNNCDISTKSLNYLLKLPRLQELKLHACKYIQDKNEVLSDLKSHRIRYLNLYNIERFNDKFYSSKELQNLTYLALKFCNVSDSNLHVISEYLSKLQFLDVSYNKNISDDGLVSSPMTGETQDIPGDKAIFNLKSLKYIDLSKCSVTVAGLIKAIRFPLLKSLILHGYLFSEKSIFILYAQNPSLMHLIHDEVLL